MKVKASVWMVVACVSVVGAGCGGPMEEDAGIAEPGAQEKPADGLSESAAQICFSNPINVGYTIKSGTSIKGSGSTSCDSARVTVQRLRWWGWEDLASRPVGANAVTATWNCRGTGTYTYRTLVKLEGYPFYAKTSNEITVSC